MPTNYKSLTFMAVALASVLAAGGCGSDSSSPSTPTAPTTPTTPTTPTSPTPMAVSIVRGASTLTTTAFAPNPITVPVGTVVTFTNNDTTTHDATADNKSFATGFISPGASANVTLSTAGHITYICTIHPGMSGTIDVQ